MANENAYILKILTGAQAGAEVAISDAEYVLGSGQDDDLHFVDLSLKPGHARLQLQGGVIKAAGGAGGVTTRAGIDILAGDETWKDIEPLDIITIGTTSFAIGSPDADWSSIQNITSAGTAPRAKTTPPIVTQKSSGFGRFAGMTALVAALVVGAGWYSTASTQDTGTVAAIDERSGLAIITEAFNDFPFARDIKVTQEVDGVILADGYVDTPAERRALRNAVDETTLQVRFRVWARDVIKNEADAIIENKDIAVQSSVGRDGVLTLRGEVLDDARVAELITTISENVVGPREIRSQVRTANTYLEQVNALLARSELDESVILRLDGVLIEASGVIVADKIDNWVGFIQSYARRYADNISLRSFVQLVDENGQIISDPVSSRPGLPVIIGSADALEQGTAFDAIFDEALANSTPISATTVSADGSDAGVVLDLNRLKEGSFGAEEVFEGLNQAVFNTGVIADETTAQQAQAAGLTQTQTTVQPQASREQLLNRTARPESLRGTRVLVNMTQAALTKETGVAALPSYVADLEFLGDVDATLDQMKYLWGPWLGSEAAEAAYLQTLVAPTNNFTECWDNSIATHANLPHILFWLDYLSVTDDVDVSILNTDAQILLLEAALNPARLRACAARVSERYDVDLGAMSLYLQESALNPEFIRFVTRQLDVFPFNLSGVNIGFENRYAQLVDGTRYMEGESPNPRSLLVNVGELGLLIKEKDRLLVSIYDASLQWKSGG